MTPNQHMNPTNEDRIAPAPYNFVPLPEKVLIPPEDECELNQSAYQGLSGYYDITIETSSPLYIRGMLTRIMHMQASSLTLEEKAHFYQINGKYRIPGSSIRGMFRNLVEIISYSRPSYVSDDRFPYRSVESNLHGRNYTSRLYKEEQRNYYVPKFMAGYVFKVGHEWKLCPAQEIEGATFARIYHDVLDDQLPNWKEMDGDIQKVIYKKVYVKLGPNDFKTIHGFLQMKFILAEAISLERTNDITQEATLVTSGPMKNKKTEALIFPQNTSLPENQWKTIPESVVNSYRTDSIPKFMRVLLAGTKGVLQDGHPVFYILDATGEIEAIGHCAMMRLPYNNSPATLLNRDLPKGDKPDFAERLFGYTDQAGYKVPSRAGRVFFEDGIWNARENPLENNGNPISPKILSTPKPTSFQHYLTQAQPNDREKLQDYDSEGTSLRGFKLYWAKGESPAYIETDPEILRKLRKQFTRIKPIKKINQFKFRLRFDNLTSTELGVLVWIIRLGKDEKYRLRLGMGKPLGLGALKFIESNLVLFDRKERYSSLFASSDGMLKWNQGFSCNLQQIEDSALESFEKWVLSDEVVNNQGNKVKNISDLERIKQLLWMLSWPGPKVDTTRYLGMLEFKPRRVLPTPSHLYASAADNQNQRQNDRPATVIAKIYDTSDGQVYCSIIGQGENVIGAISQKSMKKYRFHKGERFFCKVLSRQEKNGEIIMILEPERKL